MVLLVPSLHAYTNIVNELRLCNNVTRIILSLILASQIVFFFAMEQANLQLWLHVYKVLMQYVAVPLF